MHNDELIRVAEYPNLRRDPHTGAVIDVDTDAYNKYLSHRQERAQQKARLSQLEERINNFESDISDIKTLLTRLLEK
jgi:chemotaxis protein histidine kinase CheA